MGNRVALSRNILSQVDEDLTLVEETPVNTPPPMIDQQLLIIGASGSGKSQSIVTLTEPINYDFSVKFSHLITHVQHYMTRIWPQHFLIPYKEYRAGNDEKAIESLNQVFLLISEDREYETISSGIDNEKDEEEKMKMIEYLKFLKLFDISLIQTIDIVLKNVNRNQLVKNTRNTTKQYVNLFSTLEYQVFKRYMLAFHVHKSAILDQYRMTWNNQNLNILIHPFWHLASSSRIEQIKNVECMKPILIYASLTGFMEMSSGKSGLYFNNAMDEILDLLSIISNPSFDQKKFIFIFTKPDVLIHLISKKGLIFTRSNLNNNIDNINRSELIDVREDVRRIIGSIVSEYENRFHQILKDCVGRNQHNQFHYHIVNVTNEVELKTIIHRTFEYSSHSNDENECLFKQFLSPILFTEKSFLVLETRFEKFSDIVIQCYCD